MGTGTLNRNLPQERNAGPATIASHFEEQAVRTPDAVAVISGETQLTYRELDARANRLARYLQMAGVGRQTLVGLAMDRSDQMLIGMLAILKAGGAYLPLDPAYPEARNAFVIEDSQTRLVVTTEQIRPNLPQTSARGLFPWMARQQPSPSSSHRPGEAAGNRK